MTVNDGTLTNNSTTDAFFITLNKQIRNTSTSRLGKVVAEMQLIEALSYKTEGRGFDSRWYHWDFSLT